MSASRNVDSLFAHGTAIEQSALYAALRYSCDLTICAAGTISPSRAIRSEKRETRFGIVIVEKTVGDSSTRAVRRRKRARCTHISKYRTRDRRKDRSRRRDRLSGWNIAPCRDIDRGRRNKIMLKLIRALGHVCKESRRRWSTTTTTTTTTTTMEAIPRRGRGAGVRERDTSTGTLASRHIFLTRFPTLPARAAPPSPSPSPLVFFTYAKAAYVNSIGGAPPRLFNSSTAGVH